jgi:hypothetical protein
LFMKFALRKHVGQGRSIVRGLLLSVIDFGMIEIRREESRQDDLGT